MILLADNTILRLLGFDRDAAPDDADLEFAFANLPQSWGVFVFIGVVALMGWLIVRTYRRENPAASPGKRRFLAFLRLLVLAVLVLVWLDPSLTYTKSRSLRPVLAVLRDASQSMAVEDVFIDEEAAKKAATVLGKSVSDIKAMPPGRAGLVDSVLSTDDWKLLRDLDAKGRLRVLDFSHKVLEAGRVPLAKADADADAPVADEEKNAPESFTGLVPLKADGTGTSLAFALREAISEKLTSAVVLFTDGQHNGSESLEDAAFEAKKRGIPVFIVGVGDPVRPVNVAVSDVYADPQVWKGDPFEVQAIVTGQGLSDEKIIVELVEMEQEGEGNEYTEGPVLAEKEIILNEEQPQQRLVFAHTFDTPGVRSITVRARPLDDERNLIDNAPASPLRVKVLDDKARVLIIAGTPNWEYRALTRLFLREPTIDLSCWLQSIDSERTQQGDTPIRELPTTQENLFEYDVVLMLDPDPREFDEAWIGLLKKFVREHSGGFLYMPGPMFSGQFLGGPRTSGIQELLPVGLGDVGDMEVMALLATNNREWPLQVVPANVDQPVMRFFADTQQSIEQWRMLPGVYWSFPAEGAKPGSRVLIEHSDPTLRKNESSRPLLVTGQFGSGRTVYLGFEGTWRWRTAGVDSEFFKRFWVQTTRYLIEGRSLAGKRRGVIESERSRYEVGDRIALTARLKELNYDPLIQDKVIAELREPGRDPGKLEFSPVENEPGTYRATLAATQPGQHYIKVSLPGEGAETIDIESSLSVTLPVKESRETWLNRPQLQDIAKLTGGRYFDIDETAQLAAALPDRIRRLEMRSQPIPVWDTNRILILIAVLLTLEWALRKRFKLL